MTTLTYEQIWEDWFQADYSWDSLDRNEHHREYSGSTKDFWRKTPETGYLRKDIDLMSSGQLIKEEGQKTYHILHLPLYYEDGTPTLKAKDPVFCNKKILDIFNNLSDNKNDEEIYIRGCIIPTIDMSHGMSFKSSISFEDCIFLGETNFDHSTFEAFLVLDGCKFLGDVRFCHTIYKSYTNISNCVFFGKSVFTEGNFENSASFEDCDFMDVCIAVRADFNESVYFRRCNFRKEFRGFSTKYIGFTIFEECSFTAADFQSCIFHENVIFKICEFFGEINFLFSTFQSHATFWIRWPESAEHFQNSFRKASFKEVVDFSQTAFNPISAFSDTRFEQGIYLGNRSEYDTTNNYKIEFKMIEDFYNSIHVNKEKYPKTFKIRSKYARKAKLIQKNYCLHNLENGCRILKKKMEDSGDKNKEQLYYKLEILTRKNQLSIFQAEYIVSQIYNIASDSGMSIIRPGIIMVFFIIPAFSLIYFLLMSTTKEYVVSFMGSNFQNTSVNAFIYAMETSLSRSFPFGAFDDISKSYTENLLTNGHKYRAFFFMIMATSESFLTIIFAFLSALAVRRRFQIN